MYVVLAGVWYNNAKASQKNSLIKTKIWQINQQFNKFEQIHKKQLCGANQNNTWHKYSIFKN